MRKISMILALCLCLAMLASAALADGYTFPLEKTGERQFIELGDRRARWLRLQNLVKSDDPSAFPALRQWEVYGRDI